MRVRICSSISSWNCGRPRRFPRRAAFLVDGEDALLEIHAGFDGAEHFVGCTEDAVEEAEFLAQQFENTAVGLVAFVQEVDDDDIVLLPVAMAAADALLDALRVPGQVVVDDQRAELQVDAFGRGFGGEQDASPRRGKCSISAVRTSTAREPEARPVLSVLLQPASRRSRCFRPAVGAVEQRRPARVAVGFKKGLQILLGAARFGEDQSLACGARFSHLLEADLQSLEKRLGFGVDADAARPRGEPFEDIDLFLQLLAVDRYRRRVWLRRVSSSSQDLVEQVVFDLLVLRSAAR